MLHAANLSKSYPPASPSSTEGGQVIISDINLDLGPEETLAIVGPSGCGKTTLLYLLCGLTQPDTGSVLLDGERVLAPSPRISFILQDYGLLPWKTVLENVALGLKIAGAGRKEREERAREQLRLMGLADREKAYPACLSGGEQQRVAIARAFAANPRLLLMDEPFSSLDAITREKLQRALLAIWKERVVPYILVTHSVEEAVSLGRRILVLADTPARQVAMFDNPDFGVEGYRDTPEFFAKVQEVRKSMDRWFL